MLATGSKARFCLTLALALVIEGKLLHCTWEDAVALRQAAAFRQATAERGARPDGPASAPCENESGCICRGATLAQAVEIPDPAALQRVLLVVAAVPLPCTAAAGADLAAAAEDSQPPPLSGRQLRARLASLLI